MSRFAAQPQCTRQPCPVPPLRGGPGPRDPRFSAFPNFHFWQVFRFSKAAAPGPPGACTRQSPRARTGAAAHSGPAHRAATARAAAGSAFLLCVHCCSLLLIPCLFRSKNRGPLGVRGPRLEIFPAAEFFLFFRDLSPGVPEPFSLLTPRVRARPAVFRGIFSVANFFWWDLSPGAPQAFPIADLPGSSPAHRVFPGKAIFLVLVPPVRARAPGTTKSRRELIWLLFGADHFPLH